jgi:flagellar assembly protein FliH
MLSRLLKDAAADAQPLILRRCALPARDGPEEASSHSSPASEEVSQLRAALSNLTIHASEQAKQAYDAGCRAGETAAKKHVEGELRGVIEKFGAAVSEVAQNRAEVMFRAEADTIRLAVEIARRILHRELSTDVSALESLIKAALKKLQSQEIYRVRVHPGQEQLLQTCLEESGRGQAIAVIGDPLQPEGGALFEINGGALDASVETQVREIERALMDQLEARV